MDSKIFKIPLWAQPVKRTSPLQMPTHDGKSILHKLPTISLYQQRSIAQRLCMMMSQMRIDMNTIHIRILLMKYKRSLMFLKIHISCDGMQITPDGSIFSPRNLRRQNYLCLVSSLKRQTAHQYDHYAHAKSDNNQPLPNLHPVSQH